MERKQFKLDRARAIAEASMEAEKVFAVTGTILKESNIVIPSAATWKPANAGEAGNSLPDIGSTFPKPAEELEDNLMQEDELIEQEHIQLTLQEAFFLIWTIDCLSLRFPSSVCEPCLYSIHPRSY
jgi:tRNA-splicing endonuclease subunit Sen2